MKIKKSIKQMAKDFRRTQRPIVVRKGKQIGYLKRRGVKNEKEIY